MTTMRRVTRKKLRQRPITHASEDAYRVGPGRPPKEFQFKPGQSGNPKGARRKTSIAPDLRALLERALGGRVTLRQGETERIVTKAAAGIEQLVNQFAKGDRFARRDLIDLAGKLGVELMANHGKAIGTALAALTTDDEALLADYLQRHGGRRDHHREDSHASLPQSKDPQKPSNTNQAKKKRDR
jgi:hypothetical protein